MKRVHRSIVAVAMVLAAAAPASALISFAPLEALNSTAASDESDPANDDVEKEVAMANDGATTWVAIWASDNSLGGTIGGDFDILFERSTDDGYSWTAAAPLTADAATDAAAADSEPAIASGSGNVWVAVWSSNNTLGGTIGNDNDIVFSRSTDDGATWSAAAAINSGAAADGNVDLDFQPSIATDGAGRWLVAWKHSSQAGIDPAGDQVFFSRSTDNGATWSAQQALGALQPPPTGLDQGVSVAWNGTSFLVVWGSIQNLGANGIDGDILSATISVPAFTVTGPALVNSNAATDSAADLYPSVAADGSDVVVAWESTENVGGAGTDFDILYSTSSDGGSTWSAVAPLASNATSDTGSDNSANVGFGDGTFFVTWDSNDDLSKTIKTDRDILFVRSDDGGGTWTDVASFAGNANKDKGDDIEPYAAANDSTGTWVVAWESTDNLSKSIGGDEDILYMRSAQDCPASPVAAASCFESTASGKSLVMIKELANKDFLLWKLVKGAAVDKAMHLADPTTTDDYVLCLYDESADTPDLTVELDIPAGGNCFAKPCWLDKPTGYLYKHKFGAASGLTLISGATGKSKVILKAKGAFRAPPLPLDQDSTVGVRLHNLGNGECFAADFSSFLSNDAAIFKAKSD